MKVSGHKEYLSTEFDQAGREIMRLLVITHSWSIRHDLELNVFSFGAHTQSLGT